MTVNVLGTKYSITGLHENDELLDGCGGLCDRYSKEIFVATEFEKQPLSTNDFGSLIRLNKRHEIIHAFLSESGLMCNSTNDWARNEEMVDWFAIQGPKIYAAWRESGALNESGGPRAGRTADGTLVADGA